VFGSSQQSSGLPIRHRVRMCVRAQSAKARDARPVLPGHPRRLNSTERSLQLRRVANVVELPDQTVVASPRTNESARFQC